MDDHILMKTNIIKDGYLRREHDGKLKKARWECNYRKYRKISKVFMPKKVLHLNYETGLQEIAILELDRAFSIVDDISNSLQYFQDITSSPDNWAGD